MNPKVIIVGGGISGLTIAHYLSSKKVYPVAVLESTNRFGGVIRTLRNEASYIEAGADAFDGKELAMLDLCSELGLQNELLEYPSTLDKNFIFQKGKVFSINISRPFEIFKNPILGLKTRMRLLFELAVPPRKKAADESVADFVRRRFGRAILEDLVRPLAQGVLMGEPERLSLREYFPQWQKAEQREGGIGRSFLRNKHAEEKPQPFFAIRGGMDCLISALSEKLERTDLMLNSKVVSLECGEGWKVVLADGRLIQSKAVCLAMPAHAAAKLLTNCTPSLAAELDKIRYDSIATVNMMFRREEFPGAISKNGFLVPGRGENWPYAALKLIGATEDGKLIRCRAFISKNFQSQMLTWGDEEIKKEILRHLADVLHILARPVWISIEHYNNALAQYQTGHDSFVSNVDPILQKLPGLFLAGNGYHGFGISDCVREARLTARQMNDYLETCVETSARIE